MTCEELFDRLTDFLDGALEPDEEAAALEHLATCRRCETTLEETRTLVQLADDERPVALDPAARASLLARIVDQATGDS